jgi:hypothetical protein
MRKIAFLLAVLAAGALVSESASAGGRVSIGIGFGFPLWYPAPWYYAPAPYYYAPPPVVVSRAPVTYIERREVAPASTDWWYYCEQSISYYPYAKTCPGGWQTVSPAPQ